VNQSTPGIQPKNTPVGRSLPLTGKTREAVGPAE